MIELFQALTVRPTHQHETNHQATKAVFLYYTKHRSALSVIVSVIAIEALLNEHFFSRCSFILGIIQQNSAVGQQLW